MSPFRVDWQPGSSAQLEVFSPQGEVTDLYQLKYTSPFRPTLRPPAEYRPLTPTELGPINAGLDELVTKLGIGGTRGGGSSPTDSAPAATEPDSQVFVVGSQLLDLIVPTYVKVDLRTRELFLEIGVDEKLLGFPWELMHDGDEFLCLKHFMCRFVNASVATPPSMHATSWLGGEFDELNVLVISVPNPLKRENSGDEYETLPEAEKETMAIVEQLTSLDGVKVHVLQGKDATYNGVWSALKKTRFHILHFNGHASFSKSSGLVLFDRDMPTGALTSFLTEGPPVFCFINACETGAVSEWKDRYNIYGIAQAILQTGAYLLGSRWKLTDTAGAAFARSFYQAWLGGEQSLGQAIRDARKDCKAASPADDLAWASYVFYGDPRVYFRKTQAPEDPLADSLHLESAGTTGSGET